MTHKRNLKELPPLEQWIEPMHSLYAQGMSDVEVMSSLKISMRAFKEFLEHSETFREAVEWGRQLSDAHWHKTVRTGVYKDVKLDPAILKLNAANRLGWTDKVEHKTDSNETLLSLPEIKQKLLEKLMSFADDNRTIIDVTPIPLAIEQQEEQEE
jgi:hypothetical protein